MSSQEPGLDDQKEAACSEAEFSSQEPAQDEPTLESCPLTALRGADALHTKEIVKKENSGIKAFLVLASIYSCLSSFPITIN